MLECCGKCSLARTSFFTATSPRKTAPSSATSSSSPPIDIGHGWLLFTLPPAEAALHPASGDSSPAHGGRRLLGAVVYLMCSDLLALMKKLEAKQVSFSPPEEEPWGIKATIKLPSGGELGVYQPTALNLHR